MRGALCQVSAPWREPAPAMCVARKP